MTIDSLDREMLKKELDRSLYAYLYLSWERAAKRNPQAGPRNVWFDVDVLKALEISV